MKRLVLFILICLLFVGAQAQTYKELSGKALKYVEQDSLVQAEKLFKEALKMEPANAHNALLFSNLGTVQRRMRHNDDAIESYSLALNLAPKTVAILLNRASLYLEQGNTDKAYVDYCDVLDLKKDESDALLYRAYIYVIRHDYKSAEIDYIRFLELQPQSMTGRMGLATVYQKEKKHRESLDLFNKLVAEFPKEAALYTARADLARDMLHPDLALIDLEEALNLDSSSVDAYLLRGEIYLDLKKKDLAKSDFEKAISLGVSRSELYEQLKLCK